MTFDASHALRFINRARAATGLPALTELPFTGAVRVDERACLLARALQAEVGGSADPRFTDHFVVRLGDQTLARAVASRTGQPCNDHAEVLLPEPLARLAVAFDRGQVERRAARYVPLGQLSFDDLETAACQAVAVVSDSSAGHSTKAEHRSSPSADSWPAGFPGRPRDHCSSPTTPSRAGARHSQPRLRSTVGAVYRTPAGSRSPAHAAPRTTPTAVTASPASAPAPGSDGRRCLAAYRGAHKLSGRRPDRARPRARRCRGGVVGPRRRYRAGALGRPRSHQLRRPRGQGRRSADPGGTDAARAARPHDDSLHPNGMAPNQPLRLVPRPRRAGLQAPRARHGAPTERWNITLDSELAVLHVGSIRRCRRGAAQITHPSLRRSTTEPPAQNRIPQARMASSGREHRVQVLGTVRTLLRGLHGCACLLRAHHCAGSPVPRAEGARPAGLGLNR